eukprot:JP446624.1.p2 GENE.JP446624.1~~JP446624.1.p2  ORF type:complete len:192 (+),score=55.40 JP446624.1:322-897(+)
MYLNQGGSYVEAVRGRRFFPIHITALAENSTRFAEYDIDASVMSISPWLLTQFKSLPDSDVEDIFTRVLIKISEVCQSSSAKDLQSKLLPLAHDLAGLVAASGLLMCVACIVVLTVALPLAFNLFMGHLAENYCEHHHMADDACDDLVQSVVALSLMLMPLFAFAVFKICKVQTRCAQGVLGKFVVPKVIF